MDDADLYGDLYGADEYDDPNPTEGSISTVKSDSKPTESASTKATSVPANEAKAASASTVKASSAPAPQQQTAPKPPSTQPPVQGQPIPTTASNDAYSVPAPVTSSIPTYLSHHDNHSAFGDRNLANGNLAAAAANGGESTVRPSEMRDEGKMFVGGLNWETTTESLTEYFSQFGKIDACTIMRDAAGRSRGFAFLTFEDPAAVNAVMVREHHLDGKIIDPKRAIPRLEHQRTQKLFVGGLAPSVTTDTLKQFFGQYGKVIDATVMVDRDSSRSKGFGFVTFEDGGSVEHLLGHGLVIDGKPVEVKLAQPRHAQQQQQQQQQRGDGYSGGYNDRSGGGAGGGGGGAVNNAGGNPPSFDANAMAQLYQRMMSAAGGGFMGNPLMAGMMGNPMMTNGMMGGGMGRGMGMNNMMGMGGAGGMMGAGGGMVGGGGMLGGNGMGGGMNQMGMQIPRGPRMMQQGQQGQQQGAGPMRSHGMRGQNTYHPYGRG